MNLITLAVHGGAGTILPSELTAEKELAYTTALRLALEAGYRLLAGGGTALDAVVAAVQLLEDEPLFNAGRGAVYTAEGTHEMDAALMEGHTLRAGAVAGLQGFCNPVLVARAVMERSGHVLLTGDGAATFAHGQGLAEAGPAYFGTAARLAQLEALKLLGNGATALDHSSPATISNSGGQEALQKEGKFGTVGAVALDVHGHLAAATSTGGITNKRFGRVGDSPIIGAGTYADGQVAISCTGWGEVYLRRVVAHRVAMLMELAGLSLAQATNQVIHHELALSDPDSGGLIAVDALGNVALPFNTAGMYRGWVDQEGKVEVRIFGD